MFVRYMICSFQKNTKMLHPFKCLWNPRQSHYKKRISLCHHGLQKYTDNDRSLSNKNLDLTKPVPVLKKDVQYILQQEQRLLELKKFLEKMFLPYTKFKIYQLLKLLWPISIEMPQSNELIWDNIISSQKAEFTESSLVTEFRETFNSHNFEKKIFLNIIVKICGDTYDTNVMGVPEIMFNQTYIHNMLKEVNLISSETMKDNNNDLEKLSSYRLSILMYVPLSELEELDDIVNSLLIKRFGIKVK